MGELDADRVRRRLRVLLVVHVAAAVAATGLALAVPAGPWALPWPPVLVVLAVLLLASSWRGFLVPSPNQGSHGLYTPSGPFLMAGLVLLPPLPLLVLALAMREYRGRFRHFNRARRVFSTMAGTTAYWVAHGPGPQQVTSDNAMRTVLALLAAVVVYAACSLLPLSLSVWWTAGVAPWRQAELWSTASVFAEAWELAAGASGAVLVLVAPVFAVLLVPLVALVLRQPAYVSALHDRDHDPKTGLLNWPAFKRLAARQLAVASRQERPVGCLMLDLDHLREINNQHGHLVGDEAIGLVSRVLATELRSTDLVARFGGEEFVVLLPDTTLADARRVCDRVRATVAVTGVALESGSLQVTVSGGLTCALPDETVDGLIGRADRLLYDAKAAGRSRIELRWGLEAGQLGP